jgi:protein TonB
VKAYILLSCCLVSSLVYAQQADDDIVYQIVQVNPQFPGGTVALNEYIEKNLRYPAKAREAKLSGKVLVRILVEKNGDISESKILLGLDYGCNEEVIRLISTFPKWIPGSQDGRLLRTYTQIVVKFNLK